MNKGLLRSALIAAAIAFSGPAMAFPASIVGTWSVVANQTVGSLVVSSQTASSICSSIVGTIFGSPMEGLYCVRTGRFQFLRKSSTTNDTVQVYEGQLSSAATRLRMGGSFSDFSADGEFSFYGTK